jgi:hypothetical protein
MPLGRQSRIIEKDRVVVDFFSERGINNNWFIENHRIACGIHCGNWNRPVQNVDVAIPKTTKLMTQTYP